VKKALGYIGLVLLTALAIFLVFSSYGDISVEELKAKYTNAASQFININGMEVHYRIEGEGPDLVLLHGTAASLHTWDAWTALLKEEYRVIRLDLPAFGLTGPSPDRDYSIQAYTKFLDSFASAIDLDSFAIAGNSLGGGIAWSFAAQYPEKVEQLILIDASGIPDDKDDPAVFRMARNPILGKLFERVTPKFFIRKNLTEVYFDDSKVTDALVNRYHDMALRTGNRIAFRDRAHVVNPDITHQLSKITAPTLIIWGAADQWIPLNNGYVFQNNLPYSELMIIDEVGHVPMEEDPETSATLAIDFLRKH